MPGPLHKLLEKQVALLGDLRQTLGEKDHHALELFLAKVNEAYFSYEDDRQLLENSMELSSKELLETNREVRHQNKEIQAIYKITTLLQEAKSFPEVYPEIMNEILKATGFSYVLLELFDSETKTLSVVSHGGMPPAVSEQKFFERPLESRASTAVLDLSQDYFYSCDPVQFSNGSDVWAALAVKTVAVLPLCSASEVIGVLTLAHHETRNLPPRTLHWFKTVTNQLASAIDRRMLDELSRHQHAQLVASSKMSTLGEMAGGVAHEINNPLAVIDVVSAQISELLEEQDLNKTLIKEMFAKVKQTTSRIAKIVQGLRTFSRDGSKDPFEIVNVFRLIDDSMSFCQERFKSHNTLLTLKPVADDLFVEARGSQISQVLVNLLNNAHDAVSELEEKWIEISARDLGEKIEICIRDSGLGIPPEVQKKMFQPFFTTKAIGSGTGLGLSISLGIVKGHQGELALDTNSPNTCILVRLPKKQPVSHKKSIVHG